MIGVAGIFLNFALIFFTLVMMAFLPYRNCWFLLVECICIYLSLWLLNFESWIGRPSSFWDRKGNLPRFLVY